MSGQSERSLLAAASMLLDSSRSLEHVADSLESMAETQASAIDRLVDKLDNMGKAGGGSAGGDKGTGPTVGGFAKGFKDITGSLSELGSSGEKIRDGFKALTEGISHLSKSLVLFAKVPQDSVDSLIKFLKDVSSRFEEIDFKKVQEGGEALKSMAQGIAVFGLAIAASSIVFAIASVGTLIIVPMIAAYSYLFYQVGKAGEEIQEGAKAIGWMGLALVGFSLGLFAVKQLAGGDWGEYAKGAMIAIAGIALFATTFYFVGKVAGEVEEGAKAMAWTGLALASLALGIAAFQLLNVNLQSVLMAGAAVAVTGLAFALIGVASSYIEEGAIALFFAGASLAVLALGLAAFRLLGMTLDEALNVGLIVAGVGATFALAGLMSPAILLGSASLIVAGVAMLVLAGGISVLSLVYNKAMNGLLAPSASDPDVTNLDAVISGVANAFFINPVKSAFMLAGAAALIVASIAMLTLSAGVLAFNFAYNKARAGIFAPDPNDPETLMIDTVISGVVSAFFINPVKSAFMLLGAAALIVASVALITLTAGLLTFNFAYKKVKDSGLFAPSAQDAEVSNFEQMMGSIVDGLVIGPIDMIGLYAAVPAWLMAGVALTTIGAGVVGFAKLVEKNIDVDKIGGMIQKVLTSVIDTFVDVGNGSYVDWDSVEDGIEAVSDVGNVISGIADGVAKMAELKFPIYDKSGKITGYFTVADKQFDLVAANMKMIIGAIAGVLTDIGKSQGDTGWFSSSNAEKGAEAIRGIGGDLVSLADFVQKAANLTFPIYNEKGEEIGRKVLDPSMLEKGGSVYRNIVSMITSVTGALAEIGSGEAASSGWFVDSDIEKGKEAIAGISQDLNGIAQMVQAVAGVENYDIVAANIKKTLVLLPQAMLEAAGIISANQEMIDLAGNALSNMAEPASRIVDVLAKMQEKGVSEGTANSLGSAISGVLNGFAGFNKGINMAGLDQAIAFLERMADAADPIEKLAGGFDKLAKNMDKFAGSFKKMNVQTVKTFDLLIDSLVVFSKVSPSAFNGLTDKGQALLSYVFEKSDKKPASTSIPITQPAPSNAITQTPGNVPVAPAKASSNNDKATIAVMQQQMQQLATSNTELAASMAQMASYLKRIEAILQGTLKVQTT